MAAADKLMDIGMLTFTLAAGLFVFYILSEQTQGKKRRQVEEMTSQLINFVIFIWVGKIILRFPRFISDPLAVLAYPSDSSAFYFAIAAIALMLLYKQRQGKLDVFPLVRTFVPVFLFSSFIYEFIDFVILERIFAFGYLLLIGVLIGVFMLVREQVTEIRLVRIIVSGWSIGVFVLMLFQPYVTVFGYMLSPIFVAVFFIVCMILLMDVSRWRKKR